VHPLLSLGVGCDGLGVVLMSWVVVVVNGGGGSNGGGWDSPRLCIVTVVVVDGGDRVEGCGLGLWQFVSHT